MIDRVTYPGEPLFQQIVQEELQQEALMQVTQEPHPRVLDKTRAKVCEVIGNTTQVTVDTLKRAPLQARHLASNSLRMVSAVALLHMSPSPADVNTDIAQNKADNVAASATARIHYDTDQINCTGFVAYNNDLLLTSAHCILDAHKQPWPITKITFGSSSAQIKFTCFPVQTFVNPEYRRSINSPHDIGAIQLNCPRTNPIGKYVGKFGITTEALSKGTEVSIKGFPKSGNGNQETTNPSISAVTDEQYNYKPYDTSTGYSGSAVSVQGRDNLPYAVAVHSGTIQYTDEGGHGARITNKTRLFLQGVVKKIGNR